MKKAKNFPFENARRITDKEVQAGRKMIEEKLGIKRRSRGRPPKDEDKFQPVSIRLHPKALEWAKKEAKRRGVGYQTVINEVLLKKVA
jgi:uncharacterized protein (DUF4415 family)